MARFGVGASSDGGIVVWADIGTIAATGFCSRHGENKGDEQYQFLNSKYARNSGVRITKS